MLKMHTRRRGGTKRSRTSGKGCRSGCKAAVKDGEDAFVKAKEDADKAAENAKDQLEDTEKQLGESKEAEQSSETAACRCQSQ